MKTYEYKPLICIEQWRVKQDIPKLKIKAIPSKSLAAMKQESLTGGEQVRKVLPSDLIVISNNLLINIYEYYKESITIFIDQKAKKMYLHKSIRKWFHQIQKIFIHKAFCRKK